MGQTKPAAGLKSLNRAADTLSTLLAQEVKELNERQKAARRENTPDPGMMKGLKEATAVLKDLAGVVKTLNDQGTELEGTECGVVLLPPWRRPVCRRLRKSPPRRNQSRAWSC